MDCQHEFQTKNSISRLSFKRGGKKFRSGFEEAEIYGIRIIAARRKKCGKCGKKKTTVEINHSELRQILEVLEKYEEKLSQSSNASGLKQIEERVRHYLIRVASGREKTRHERRAMYKEVWNHIYPNREFGRGNTNEVVSWIVAVSNFDIAENRPPLNSLVVRGDTGMPRDSWEEWRQYSTLPYQSVQDAQTACWNYWA